MKRQASGEIVYPAKIGRSNSRSPEKACQSAVGSSQRLKLPKHFQDYWKGIKATIRENNITLIMGMPGLGKSKLLPLVIYDEMRHNDGTIVVVHSRHAEIDRCSKFAIAHLGDEVVGCQKPFSSTVTKRTRLKFITDGEFMRELGDWRSWINDDYRKYSHIIIDDVDKRHWQSDLLIGFLRISMILRRRDKLYFPKVLLVGASTDAEDIMKCCASLSPNSVLIKDHRTTPIEYSEVDEDIAGNIVGIAIGAVRTVLESAEIENPQILCYLPSRDEVIQASAFLAKSLRGDQADSGKVIQTLFRGVPTKQLNEIQSPVPEGCRRIVFSDDIAEVALEIPGINTIIDCGLRKENRPISPLSISADVIQRISVAESVYREQRLKRTNAQGHFFRLFKTSDPRPQFTVPKLQSRPAVDVILRQIEAGLSDKRLTVPALVLDSAYDAAYVTLRRLGAIEPFGKTPTAVGKKMASLPLDMQSARTVIAASELGCLAEVLTVIAVLNSGPLRNNEDKDMKRYLCSMDFNSCEGDLVTILKVFRAYKETVHRREGSWCKRHFYNPRTLTRAVMTRKSLRAKCMESGLQMSTAGENLELINCAFMCGYIFHLAYHVREEVNGMIHHTYRLSFTDDEVELPLNSSLRVGTPPQLVVSINLRQTAAGSFEMTNVFPVSPLLVHQTFPNLVSPDGKVLPSVKMTPQLPSSGYI